MKWKKLFGTRAQRRPVNREMTPLEQAVASYLEAQRQFLHWDDESKLAWKAVEREMSRKLAAMTEEERKAWKKSLEPETPENNVLFDAYNTAYSDATGHEPDDAMNKIPDGWTDDLTIAVPTDRSLDDVVDYCLQATIRKEPPEKIVQHLMVEFGLSRSDAELALDRSCGGVVRAATGRQDNCPAREKDPMAWLSFQRCLKQPELIVAIYPQFARPSEKP